MRAATVDASVGASWLPAVLVTIAVTFLLLVLSYRVFDRLQKERIAAFRDYAEDVRSGAYPEKGHLVGIEPSELAAFLERMGS